MGSFEMNTCDLKGCKNQIASVNRSSKGWVCVEGQVWAFGRTVCPMMSRIFCSWEHFTKAAEKGFTTSEAEG